MRRDVCKGTTRLLSLNPMFLYNCKVIHDIEDRKSMYLKWHFVFKMYWKAKFKIIYLILFWIQIMEIETEFKKLPISFCSIKIYSGFQMFLVVYNLGFETFLPKNVVLEKIIKFIKFFNFTKFSCIIFCPKMFQCPWIVYNQHMVKVFLPFPSTFSVKIGSTRFFSQLLVTTIYTILPDIMPQELTHHLFLSASCFSKWTGITNQQAEMINSTYISNDVCQAKSLTLIIVLRSSS